MPALPEITVVRPPGPVPARGSWWRRAARAVFREGRLPTAWADGWDRLAIGAGLRRTTLVQDDVEGSLTPARLRVRRQTADRFFVAEVFVDHVYCPPGYEICETDTVIDVGANVGAFTVFAARRARRGRVLAFEPTRESFSLLQRNIRKNRLTNVTAARAAIDGATGRVTMHLSDGRTGGHSLNAALARNSSTTEEVDSLSLADVFAQNEIATCHVLKLDCEGAEYAIVESLRPELARRVERVVLEYHTDTRSPKREQSDVLARRLVELGFAIDVYTDVLGTNRGLVCARRETI